MTRAKSSLRAGVRFPARLWTDEQIIEAIQKWNEKYGFPPRQRQWEHRGEWWPSHYTVNNHFGSWAKGIRAAGFRLPRATCGMITYLEVIDSIGKKRKTDPFAGNNDRKYE